MNQAQEKKIETSRLDRSWRPGTFLWNYLRFQRWRRRLLHDSNRLPRPSIRPMLWIARQTPRTDEGSAGVLTNKERRASSSLDHPPIHTEEFLGFIGSYS